MGCWKLGDPIRATGANYNNIKRRLIVATDNVNLIIITYGEDAH